MLSQRFSINELGGDEVKGIRLADLVDRDDVRMIERRGRSRLPLESTQLIRIVVEGSWEELESHFTIQLHVESQIDLTHPTRT